MLRRVAFKKAILAGAFGALAWELVTRALLWFGFPVFDLVYVLGTMFFGSGAAFWKWWIAGLALHATVGAIWAIFYAYFFWSMFDYPYVLQGILFSLLPAALAGLIMIPQMDFMHPLIANGKWRPNGVFAAAIGWSGPVMVVLGHLVYGAVLGGIYTKPVGYPAGRKISFYG